MQSVFGLCLIVLFASASCALVDSPIAGTEFLGCGYNMLQSSSTGVGVGTPLRNPIFAPFTYYNNQTWNVGDNTYPFPDQARIVRLDTFGVRSYVYQSVEDYTSQLTKNFGLGLQGKVKHITLGLCAGLSAINSQMQKEQSTLAIGQETIPLYSLRMFPGLELSSTFVNAVKYLPTSYTGTTSEISIYEDFIYLFGTHVQTGLDMGGQITISGLISNSEYSTQTSMNGMVGVRVALFKHKTSDISMYQGINRNYSPFPKTTFHEEVIGGNPKLVPNNTAPGTNWFSNWVDSVSDYPAAANYQLRPIEQYIKQVSPSAADAFVQYMNALEASSNIAAAKIGNNPVILTSAGSASCAAQANQNGNPYSELWTWYTSDDDDCMNTAWTINDYSSQAVGTNKCQKVSLVDWYVSNVFGYPQFSSHTLDQTTAIKQQPLRTTSLMEYNNMCGAEYPCLPGLDSMGIGVDIITGSRKLPIFKWTFNDNRHMSYNHEVFSYPDQVQVTVKNYVGKKSGIYPSFHQYVQSGSSSTAEGWDGLVFQFGVDEQSSYRSFDGAQSVLGSYEAHYVNYLMNMNKTSYQLSEQFLQAVSLLPQNYSVAEYSAFIADWGTHIITDGTYGGKARLVSLIDQSYFSSQTSSSMQASLGVQFDNWEAQIGWGNSQGSQLTQFTEHTYQQMTFFGGDGSLAMTNQWKEWTNSTSYRPAQINQAMIPLQHFVSNTVVANNIARAVAEYNQSSTQPMNPPAPANLQMKIQSYSGRTFLTGYKGTCLFKHGFANEDRQQVATGCYYADLEVNLYNNHSPIQVYKIDERSYSAAWMKPVMCPPNALVTQVVTSHPNCPSTTSCANGFGTPVMKTYLTYCSQAGYYY